MAHGPGERPGVRCGRRSAAARTVQPQRDLKAPFPVLEVPLFLQFLRLRIGQPAAHVSQSVVILWDAPTSPESRVDVLLRRDGMSGGARGAQAMRATLSAVQRGSPHPNGGQALPCFLDLVAAHPHCAVSLQSDARTAAGRSRAGEKV